MCLNPPEADKGCIPPPLGALNAFDDTALLAAG